MTCAVWALHSKAKTQDALLQQISVKIAMATKALDAVLQLGNRHVPFLRDLVVFNGLEIVFDAPAVHALEQTDQLRIVNCEWLTVEGAIHLLRQHSR